MLLTNNPTKHMGEAIYLSIKHLCQKNYIVYSSIDKLKKSIKDEKKIFSNSNKIFPI